jgi:deoxyribodipyrimidine photo-lyase
MCRGLRPLSSLTPRQGAASRPDRDAARVDPTGRGVRRSTVAVDASPALVWLRDDLRLDDNPALAASADRPTVALYVLEDGPDAPRALGGAARWWLHHALSALAAGLAARGAALVLRRGDPRVIVPGVALEHGFGSVFWNRRYRPADQATDAAVKADLKQAGVEARSFKGALLFEPWEIQTGSGGPYKVFTPFWRAAQSRAIDPPYPTPPAWPQGAPEIASEALDDWALLPAKPDWAGGLRAAWTPGEAGAHARLERFLDGPLKGYAQARNLPAVTGTSRLSPHLRFGEIGPRRVYRAAAAAAARRGLQTDGEVFHTELGWREFSYGLLNHFPEFPETSWKPEFERMPWRDDPAQLSAWQRGQTGYPIVDAGMRELWTTGWIHNRVRMIVGSFLVKHLMIHWRRGEEWFWDTLVDADPANNAAGWQWIAGSGADAAPYFRIFNPVTQGEKFDPEGAYVRRWAPELGRLPNAFVHKPWQAPSEVLRAAGLRLGLDYPYPIVDHAQARQRALDAYAGLKAA